MCDVNIYSSSKKAQQVALVKGIVNLFHKIFSCNNRQYGIN
jgi:hypothetical protein